MQGDASFFFFFFGDSLPTTTLPLQIFCVLDSGGGFSIGCLTLSLPFHLSLPCCLLLSIRVECATFSLTKKQWIYSLVRLLCNSPPQVANRTTESFLPLRLTDLIPLRFPQSRCSAHSSTTGLANHHLSLSHHLHFRTIHSFECLQSLRYMIHTHHIRRRFSHTSKKASLHHYIISKFQ